MRKCIYLGAALLSILRLGNIYGSIQNEFWNASRGRGKVASTRVKNMDMHGADLIVETFPTGITDCTQ
jgi:hypothetical protein